MRAGLLLIGLAVACLVLASCTTQAADKFQVRKELVKQGASNVPFPDKKKNLRPHSVNSIKELIQKAIYAWLDEGHIPDAPFDGCSPAFAHELGIAPADLNFDRFIARTRQPGWSLRPIKFAQFYDGPFAFYLPDSWSKVKQSGPTATVGDAASVHQSIALVPKETWRKTLPKFFKDYDIEAAAYYPRLQPNYNHWIICSLPKQEDHHYWLFSISDGGEHLVIVKADAKGKKELETQLTSLVNTNPWYGWIEAVKRKRKSE